MRRYVITIWDNPEFACEISYVAAKRSNMKVLLIDADLLNPTVDLFLKIKRFSDKIENKKTGLELALDSINYNILSYELLESICCKRRELNNLSILTGNYSLNNYEYFSMSFIDLIKKCTENYDLTFIIANKFIYDAYTIASLSISDFNILPLHAYLPTIREFNNYLSFLQEKQCIPMEKTKFVAFSYTPQNHISCPMLKTMSEGNFWGSVGFSRKRIRLRKSRVPYVRIMEKKIESDYVSILSYLDIDLRKTFKEKYLRFKEA